jgi:hypothetical protein
MRALALFAALSLAACGPSEPPPPLPEPEEAAAAPPWLICDAINAPVLLRFERANGVATVTQYEKPSGATVQTTSYTLAEPEGAAGSVITALLQHGAEAGAVRQINPGMLETPGSAYTPPFSSVRIGDRNLTCRWLPRTRLMGFTGRRTIVVHEDADGDLIYTSYDFATAADVQPIDLSDNGRTTTFSLEARDGAETTDAAGTRFQFQADTETEIVVTARRDGTGAVEVRRHEPNPVQSEDLIAFQVGDGGA